MKGCQCVLKWKVQTAKQVADGNSIFTLMSQILEKIGCDFYKINFLYKDEFSAVNFTNACLKCLQ